MSHAAAVVAGRWTWTDAQVEEFVNSDGANAPIEICCPITHALVKDPVRTEHGGPYERAAARLWFREHSTDPLTNLTVVRRSLKPDPDTQEAVKSFLDRVLERHPSREALTRLVPPVMQDGPDSEVAFELDQLSGGARGMNAADDEPFVLPLEQGVDVDVVGEEMLAARDQERLAEALREGLPRWSREEMSPEEFAGLHERMQNIEAAWQRRHVMLRGCARRAINEGRHLEYDRYIDMIVHGKMQLRGIAHFRIRILLIRQAGVLNTETARPEPDARRLSALYVEMRDAAKLALDAGDRPNYDLIVQQMTPVRRLMRRHNISVGL